MVWKLQDLSEIFKNTEFVPFRKALDEGGVIKGIVVEDFAPSNKEIKKLTADAKKNGASGLVVFKNAGWKTERICSEIPE